MAKKKVAIAGLTIVLVLLASLVSTVSAKENKYVWKCGTPCSKDHSAGKAQLKFAELVKERTNGQIEVKIYFAEALGKAYDEFENIVRGTQEMGFLPPSPHFNKALQVVYMPYIVRTWEEGREVYGPDGWMFKLLKPLYEEIGLELLGLSHLGMDGYGSTKGPVTKPSDIKDLGIKTRVWCTADRLLFEPLGGTVHIAFPDLYTALQTGLCHAQDNAPQATYMQLRDVTKYYTPINWMFEVFSVLINKKLYDSLTPELKDAVRTSMAETLTKYNAEAEKQDEIYLQKMEKYGIKVNRLTPMQLVPWVEQGRSIWPKMKEECGADTVEQVIKRSK